MWNDDLIEASLLSAFGAPYLLRFAVSYRAAEISRSAPFEGTHADQLAWWESLSLEDREFALNVLTDDLIRLDGLPESVLDEADASLADRIITDVPRVQADRDIEASVGLVVVGTDLSAEWHRDFLMDGQQRIQIRLESDIAAEIAGITGVEVGNDVVLTYPEMDEATQINFNRMSKRRSAVGAPVKSQMS